MKNRRGTFLIVGGTNSQRDNKAKEICDIPNLIESADVRILEVPVGKKSIGIEQTRKASIFLNEKPFEKEYKILIIKQADRLTNQAQNSLLKTLEEPPVYAQIVLLVEKEKSLLPTVISRCKIMRLNTDEIVHVQNALPESISELLEWAKNTSKEDTETIINILRDQLSWWRNNTSDMGIKEAKNMELTLQIIDDLENVNINKSLLLEHYVLNLLVKD